MNQLVALVAKRGREPLIASPLLEPSDRFFPDRFEATPLGVRTLVRRLLTYADLPQLGVVVESFATVQEVHTIDPRREPSHVSHEGAVAWFAGISQSVCHFGIDERQFEEPEKLVGTLCHEVAHAFRSYHALSVPERDLEERLTDLTTVYLGFGILTTNNAYRFRSKVESGFGSRASHSRTGYLSPSAMSFLLAAQVVGRSMTPQAVRKVERALEPNQADSFAAAVKVLGAAGMNLPERFRVSARPERRRDASPLPFPVAAPRPASVAGAGELDAQILPIAGPGRKLTTRVPRSRMLPHLALALVMASLLAVMAWRVLAASELFIGGLYLTALAIALVTGKILRWDHCSDPACRSWLPVNQGFCPKCGAKIVGQLDARTLERIEAERVLRDTRRP